MAASPPTAPNLIFILVDDLGWKDLACYGSSFYETPNLDRLAAGGMRFTNAYAASPVCSPTRASALTGKYPATVGITQYIGGHNVGHLCDVPYLDRLPQNEYTLPMALRDHGDYQTWHVGKWHLGPREAWPDRRGFDVNIGGADIGGPHKRGYFSPWDIPNLQNGPDGEYLTDRLNSEAIQLIENRDPTRPFFLNYWPYAVHTPIQAPEHLIEKYRQKAQALGLDQIEAIVEGEPIENFTMRQLGRNIQRRVIQSDPRYAAMVENLDTNIGLLIAALEAQGILDNTLIVFTSDNGGLSTNQSSPTSNAPLAEGKGWMYEGGTREPFIAHWPGTIPAGTVSETLVTTPDIYPTLLAAAKLAPIPSQHIDGVNLLPALQGDATFDRGPIFWHYPHYSDQGGRPGSSVREGDWKLIEFFEDDRLELYNLREDISEKTNLAAQHPDIRDRLHEKLKTWRNSVQALIPRKNPHWEMMSYE